MEKPVLTERVEQGHVQFKLKCLECGLHFIVVSWFRDWYKQTDPRCPECHGDSVFLMRVVESKKQIFEVVPGVE